MCDSGCMVGDGEEHSALYDHFGWRVRATPIDMRQGRLAETHEYFHRQLDDTTAFGGLIGTVAAVADSTADNKWKLARRHLQEMVDLVHEAFAVGMSLLTTQRPLQPIENYPTYDVHVRTAARLIGSDIHPWVALAGLRAAAMASMQSGALEFARAQGLRTFDASRVPVMERPNHRLAALLTSHFAAQVQVEQERAVRSHRQASWWQPAGSVTLSPDSMDGDASEAFAELFRRLFQRAADIVGQLGGSVVGFDDHVDDLRALLAQARELAPEGLTRIGALVESPGGELLHGGPLDGQILELANAPRHATLLPYGTAAATSGDGDRRHAFVVVTTPRRLRAYERLEGMRLPASEAIACLRSTVFDGDTRHSILLVQIDEPDQISETDPVYVCAFSSAAAADPVRTQRWMRWAEPSRVSLVIDTPATAALRRWCAHGARFACATRQVQAGDDDLRLIAGRVEDGARHSPLVVIPSTEFGARWFDSACAEDPVLSAAIVDDPELFDRESDHFDVVLSHLLLEERYLGTGSWRR